MTPRSRPPLGQHFLSDVTILRNIVDALDPAPEDLVLEIGAGRGALTVELAARVGRVVAMEKDRRIAHDCGLRIADCGMANVEIVVGDALRIDWYSLFDPQSAIPNPQWKILGNIPYAITSPLIEKALTPPLPERIVFLVQAEVADRVAAGPGSRTYGALSVGVQAQCRVERLFTVKAGAFQPPPKVDSALLRLTPLPSPLVAPEEGKALRRFVTACFSRRRKQLRNVLVAATGRPAGDVTRGLDQLAIDPAARPETLAPRDFVRLLHWSSQL